MNLSIFRAPYLLTLNGIAVGSHLKALAKAECARFKRDVAEASSLIYFKINL